MVVTREKIRDWLGRATDTDEYMVVHSDNFSHEYYPTYHKSHTAAVNEVNSSRAKNMHSIIEVYDLTDDLEPQIESKRTMRI